MFRKVRPYMGEYMKYTRRAAVSVTVAVILSVIPYFFAAYRGREPQLRLCDAEGCDHGAVPGGESLNRRPCADFAGVRMAKRLRWRETPKFWTGDHLKDDSQALAPVGQSLAAVYDP